MCGAGEPLTGLRVGGDGDAVGLGTVHVVQEAAGVGAVAAPGITASAQRRHVVADSGGGAHPTHMGTGVGTH